MVSIFAVRDSNEGGSVKRLILSFAVVGLLAGPMGAVAGANPIKYIKENGVPTSGCEVQEALGVVNVKECEDYSS